MVISGNTCIRKVAIYPIALILCLLFGCVFPQNFHFLSVGLVLSDVEHLLSLLDETIIAYAAAKVKGFVPVSELAADPGG